MLGSSWVESQSRITTGYFFRFAFVCQYLPQDRHPLCTTTVPILSWIRIYFFCILHYYKYNIYCFVQAPLVLQYSNKLQCILFTNKALLNVPVIPVNLSLVLHINCIQGRKALCSPPVLQKNKLNELVIEGGTQQLEPRVNKNFKQSCNTSYEWCELTTLN